MNYRIRQRTQTLKYKRYNNVDDSSCNNPYLLLEYFYVTFTYVAVVP
jgi:hypothetical protein